MSASATISSYSAIVRDLWPQSSISDELYENNPFFAMVPKDTSFSEKKRHIAIGFGPTAGLGSTFSAAKAAKASSVLDEWQITRQSYFSLYSIDRQLLKSSKDKKAAITSAIARETSMAMKGWKRRMSIYTFGDGIGAMGRISAINTNTITLTTLSDVKHFEKNYRLNLSVDNTGVAGVRAQSLPLIVSKINRRTGVITFTTNVTDSIPGALVNDYVYYDSDYNNVIQGVQAWIPSSDPSATLFNGMDRTQDSLRLAGIRTSGKNLSPRAALQKGMKEVCENSNEPPTHVFLSADDFYNLQMELQAASAAVFVTEPGAKIGTWNFGVPFKGLQVMGPAGYVPVFLDINVPTGQGYIFNMPSWTLASLGDVPNFDLGDGAGEVLRETDSDSVEGRLVGDLNLYCSAPGANGVVLFNA